MDDIRIAAVCMKSFPGEIDRNLEKIDAFVRKASELGTDIICFPELSISGYVLERPKEVYAKGLQKAAIERLKRIAIEERIVVIAGLIEIQGKGKPYISQIVFGPKGLIGKYRKTHLSPAENNTYRAGDDLKIFSSGGTNFGIQLCYEVHFPEISTIMALDNVQVIFVPHASPRGNPASKLSSWMRHMSARAFDNGIYLVACNQVGKTSEGLSFPGVAVVIGPDGQIVSSYTGKKENILVVDVKADKLKKTREHRMRYFIPYRRPDLYGRILG